MGNEMGNSNTSGLQEEENSTPQVQEKFVQEAGHADSAEVENHNAPLAEVRDYRGKDNEGATDVRNGAANPHVANHTSYEKEVKETQPPAESPNFEVRSNSSGASDESSEMKPNYISNDSKDNEKPPGNTDGEGDNHIVPVAEDKDFYEKEINGLPSGVPKEAEDPHIVNQISDEKEQETEVIAQAEYPKFEIKTDNEAGSEISDTQPTSPSKHSKDHERQQESNLTDNLQQISDHQLEKQTSIKKEEEGTENSTSETIQSSHDPEPQESDDSKFDQSDPRTQGSNGSLHSHDDILGSNLNCNSAENAHLIGTKISEDMDETVVTGSNLEVELVNDDLTVKERATEVVFHEDRLAFKDEGEIGTGFGGKPIIKSGFPDGDGTKTINTDSPKAGSEINFMDESPSPQIGNSESTDNGVFIVAETALTEKESAHVENKPGDCLIRSCEESVKELKSDTANLSQSELLIFESVGENKQKRVADFTCCGGSKACTEEAKVAENGHLVDEHIDDQNEASVEHSKDSQKEAEMVPESGIVSTESSLTDCKRVEDTEERQIIEEIEERTRDSYGIGNNAEGRDSGEQYMSPVEQEEISLPEAPLSLVQPQDNQQNNSIQSTKIESSGDSISELKQENNDDFLVIEASCFDSKNLMVETSVQVAELAIEKPEQDLSWHTAKTMMAAAEANTQVNNVSEQCAKVEASCFDSKNLMVETSVPVAELAIEKPEQDLSWHTAKTMMAAAEANTQVNNVSDQCAKVEASCFDSKNLMVETSVPVAELAIEKPEQDLSWHTAKTMMAAAEANTRVNNVSEQCAKVEASCFDSKNLMVETSVPVAELAIEKDLSWDTAKTMMAAAEANIQVNNVSEQCARVETPASANDDYEVIESVGRLSTESNSNNSNTQAQMQKSPSFGLDLRIEARTEESDRTPLLWQDKTATEDFSGEQEVSLSSPIAHTHYDQDKLQYQAMPVEEKIVRMERSDSEKLKTPFLSFLKEEEEAHNIVTPQKHDNSNAAAKKANKESLNLHTKEVKPRSKEKRKPRNSLFTTCICCTTVIN